MKNMLKKTVLAVTTAAFALTLPVLTWAQENDIIILHTNDIHCGVNDNLTFSGIAHFKKETLAKTPNVALVDAGDAIQGAPIGKLSNGLAVVNIMNEVGYDMLIPGNHEFDYGMDRFLELAPLQKAGYYSANFIDLRTKKTVLPPYKMLQYEDKKVAFVGVTTPEALTTSTPTYFQDDKGKYVYSFCEDKTGKKLYKQLQKTVNKARKEGADYVFLVGHLGIDGSTPYWSSPAIAANTKGVDGIIDGHSHEKIVGKTVTNKAGKEVIIAQTGTKLKTVGQITITPDGKLDSKLVSNVDGHDKVVDETISREIAIYEPLLKQPLGEATVKMHSYDPQSGKRIVRNADCNLGDFTADALRSVLDTDVAIINGGCIRNELPVGVITYNDFLEAYPFGNMCMVVDITGQQLLDGLEMGAMSYPEESGGFMHVSGLRYTINKDVASPVQLSDKGEFIGVNGQRRVTDVMIGDELLDVNKTYRVGGSTYMLKSGGDGMTMFRGGKIIQDSMLSDIDCFIEYFQNHLNGVLGDQYANPYGDGRITIK